MGINKIRKKGISLLLMIILLLCPMAVLAESSETNDDTPQYQATEEREEATNDQNEQEATTLEIEDEMADATAIQGKAVQIPSDYSGYLFGKVTQADGLTEIDGYSCIGIDYWDYKVSDDLNISAVAKILVEKEDPTVICEFQDGIIIRVDAVTDIFRPVVRIVDPKPFIYENGQYEVIIQEIKLRIGYDLTAKATGVYDVEKIRKAKGNAIALKKVTLQLSDKQLYFLDTKEQEQTISIDNIYYPGKTTEKKVKVAVITNILPKEKSKSISMTGKVTFSAGGSKDCLGTIISILNMDIQKAKATEKKKNTSMQKSVETAKKSLNANTAIALEPGLEEYFTTIQIEEIKDYLTVYVAQAIGSQSFGPQDMTQKLQEKVRKKIMSKLGMKTNPFLFFNSMTLSTKVKGTSKKYGDQAILFTINISSYSMDEESVFSSMGTIDWEVENSWNNSSIPDGVDKEGTGIVTFTDLKSFTNQVKSIANDSILGAFNAVWGNNANEVASLFVQEPFKKLVKGHFSDNVYALLSAPTESYLKKVKVKCPVDVEVYDWQGDLCGKIENNVIVKTADDIYMEVYDDEKYIYLTENDYAIKMIGNDTGTLDYTVEEYLSNRLIGSKDTSNVPLDSGTTYYGLVPEANISTDSLFSLITDNGSTFGDIEDTEYTEKDPELKYEDEGKCGDNVYYQYYTDGLLKIYGSGPMYDYRYDGYGEDSDAPWSNDSNINYVVVEEGVTSIGENSFRACKNLKDVQLADSVEKIGGSAFIKCNLLSTITIGQKLKEIEDFSLSYCERLSNYFVNEKNQYFTSDGSVLYSKDKKTLIKCATLQGSSYTIPEGVTTIGTDAFADNTKLEILTLPSTLKEFSIFAFDNTAHLKELKLARSNHLTVKDNVLYNKTMDTLIFYPMGKDGETFKVPDSVKYIDNEAMSKNLFLKELDLNQVEKVGFDGCSGLMELKKVTLDYIKELESSAFMNCPKLKEVNTPKTLTSIGACALGYIDYQQKNSDFSLYGYSGTEAEKYAKSYGIPFYIRTEPVPSINDREKTVSGIVQGQTGNGLLTALKEASCVDGDSVVSIRSKDGTILSLTNAIGTGMVITIDGSSGKSQYTAVVLGDNNGDAAIDVMDMLAIQDDVLGKNYLVGYYRSASKINGDTEVDVMDMLAIQDDVLGKTKINPYK